jgi:hypothetical protein
MGALSQLDPIAARRLFRLAPPTKQDLKPEFDDRNDQADPHASRHADGDGGDCKEGQHQTSAVHGQDSSTAKALPHVVTALITKRSELARGCRHEWPGVDPKPT